MKYFIYKIVNKYNKNNFYVGSTKDLKYRIIKHKQSCKKPKFKIHMFITENGGFNNFYFYIIDTIYCEEGKQRITEDKYITELNPPLNTYKAYIENKEEQKKQYYKQYNEANKEKLKEQRKQYNENNKEQKKEQAKQYYEANAKKIKEQRNKYRQANKEKLKEQNKQYRQANKEKIKEQHKQHIQRKKQELI